MVKLRGYTNLALPWDERCTALLAVLDAVATGRVSLAHQVLPLEDAATAWAGQLRGVARLVLLT